MTHGARGPRRAIQALLAAALVLAPGPCAPREPRPSPPPRHGAVVGPLATWLASIEWVRYQSDLRAGRPAAAIRHAENALDLDPGDPEGWELLAHHLGFTLASVEREPDPAVRLAWVRAALAVLARGEARCRDPGALALAAGLLLEVHAELDPELPWPGGVAALRRAATEHFARAVRLGHPEAAPLLDRD